MEGHVSNLRNYLLANHLFCGLVIITGQRVNKAYFTLMQCMIIIATMTQLFAMIWVAQMIFVDDRSAEDQSIFTTDFLEFINWLLVELWAMIAIVGSNGSFLLVRSLVTQKTFLNVAALFRTETTDFLESQQVMLTIFNSLITPIFILSAMLANGSPEMVGYGILQF